MKYFDDFQLGDKMVFRGRTVTETDIVNFAALSGDWYPLHVDKEFARKSQFGERIAHGLLTLSIASGLIPFTDMALIAFYGMDKVRFTAPTKIGDTIHAELEVADKQDKNEHSGIVTFRLSVKNQRGEDVVIGMLKDLLAKHQSIK